MKLFWLSVGGPRSRGRGRSAQEENIQEVYLPRCGSRCPPRHELRWACGALPRPCTPQVCNTSYLFWNPELMYLLLIYDYDTYWIDMHMARLQWYILKVFKMRAVSLCDGMSSCDCKGVLAYWPHLDPLWTKDYEIEGNQSDRVSYVAFQATVENSGLRFIRHNPLWFSGSHLINVDSITFPSVLMLGILWVLRTESTSLYVWNRPLKYLHEN